MLKNHDEIAKRNGRYGHCFELLFLGFEADSEGRGVIGNQFGSTNSTWGF